MPKPKRLSGAEVVRVLETFGFSIRDQRGSHIKLARTVDSQKQTLVIPNHNELATGAVVAIFRQANRYIPEQELRPHFYSL